MTFFNLNLLISILVFFTTFLLLDMLDKGYNYEHFLQLNLENINQLDDNNSLKIAINDVNNNLINNTFYGSKFYSDNFMLILDDLCYDYINFSVKTCNTNNLRLNSVIENLNFDQSLETNKQKLKSFLIEKLDFVPQINIDNFIGNKIHIISNLYFNEYIFNCA